MPNSHWVRPQILEQSTARSHLCTRRSYSHFLGLGHSWKQSILWRSPGSQHFALHRFVTNRSYTQLNLWFPVPHTDTMSWEWIGPEDCYESKESTRDVAELTAATQFCLVLCNLPYVLTFEFTWLCNVRYKSPWTFCPQIFRPMVWNYSCGNRQLSAFMDKCFKRKRSLAIHGH